MQGIDGKAVTSGTTKRGQAPLSCTKRIGQPSLCSVMDLDNGIFVTRTDPRRRDRTTNPHQHPFLVYHINVDLSIHFIRNF